MYRMMTVDERYATIKDCGYTIDVRDARPRLVNGMRVTVHEDVLDALYAAEDELWSVDDVLEADPWDDPPEFLNYQE